MKRLVLLLFMCMPILVVSQNIVKHFPKNPKSGKCYRTNFQYDKKFSWKEIDCPAKTTVEIFWKGKDVKKTQAYIKLKKYQEKLISLGFNIKVTGFINDETIDAHHAYLKLKQKQARKEKRKLKKLKRKQKDSI